MPMIALLALFVAFGSPPVPGSIVALAPDHLAGRVTLMLAGVAGVGAVAGLIGGLVARRLVRPEATFRSRRLLSRVSRGLDFLSLVVFALIVHGDGWDRVVRDCLGLGRYVLADEALILLPFVLMQLVCWAGLYPAERVPKLGGPRPSPPRRLGGDLLLKARHQYGLVLPVAGLFALLQDLEERYRIVQDLGPWGQLATFGVLGATILVASPALVRLSWPASPMPPGPLRDRLERLARRFGFRFTEILVWDTGGAIVNAGVTGALPWFRYVLVTDAMVENLTPRQIEAVFGHELGHVAHRHLASFGGFFLGTVGVMALLGKAVEWFDSLGPAAGEWGRSGWAGPIVEAAVLLGFAVGYFFLIFGYLSRRFERQADIFGCRAVSCGRADCPPHLDINADPDAEGSRPDALCPVGIGIFVEALMSVAMLNGIEPRSASWRHGSIARRIAFLRGLEGRPEAEHRFQRRVAGLRLALGLALSMALILAVWSGAMEALR